MTFQPNTSVIFGPNIAGDGGVTINAEGQNIALTGNITYAGDTTVAAGTLTLVDNFPPATSTVNLTTSSTTGLLLNPTADVPFLASLTGAGSINLNTANKLTLTGGQVDYTGSTTLAQGGHSCVEYRRRSHSCRKCHRVRRR